MWFKESLQHENGRQRKEMSDSEQANILWECLQDDQYDI